MVQSQKVEGGVIARVKKRIHFSLLPDTVSYVILCIFQKLCILIDSIMIFLLITAKASSQ